MLFWYRFFHFHISSGLCLSLILLCSPVSLLAKPVITSVHGQLSDNNSIRIIGTQFGIKNPAPPIIWADFEDGTINPSTLGQRSAWNYSENMQVTASNQMFGSVWSSFGEWDSSSSKKSFSFRIDKRYWTKIYHYQKRYFDFTITSNQKYWRLWPESGGNDFVALWHGTNSGMCYNETENYVGGKIGGYQGRAPNINQWNIEEFIWQHSGGSGLNQDGTNTGHGTGIWIYTVNGIQNQYRENIPNGPSNHVQLRTDNFTDSAALPPDGSRVYLDDIYIDDTYARVMLGNAETLSGSTHREIQIPQTWSDTDITITFNQGSFRSGESVYLFVINANGEASTGFPVSIGDGYSLPIPSILHISIGQSGDVP